MELKKSPPDARARRARAEMLVQEFVRLHAANARQRSAAWFTAKKTTIGGSELAALMGVNPYSSFSKIVRAKAGLDAWDGAKPACWWGTMFESVIERVLEIDCGVKLYGSDIHVPAPRGSRLRGLHANSPDGYAVLNLYRDGENNWKILTTDNVTQESARGRERAPLPVLVEFKCPYRRRPKTAVPRHYQPQLWSGLALAPVVDRALFVDAVFRKCALWNLGPSTGYDRWYHRERTYPEWTTPVAWGVTAVYAPRLSVARAKARDDGVHPGYEAWKLHYEVFGIPYESSQETARGGRAFRPDPVDFGDCAPQVFDKMLGLLDRGCFQARQVPPCFADGRGSRLRSDKEIGQAIDRLGDTPPSGHFLLGFIPWKMLELCYIFEERRAKFLEEIEPLVRSCLQAAAKIRRSPDPQEAYRAWAAEKFAAPPVAKRISPEVQELFDLL